MNPNSSHFRPILSRSPMVNTDREPNLKQSLNAVVMAELRKAQEDKMAKLSLPPGPVKLLNMISIPPTPKFDASTSARQTPVSMGDFEKLSQDQIANRVKQLRQKYQETNSNYDTYISYSIFHKSEI